MVGLRQGETLERVAGHSQAGQHESIDRSGQRAATRIATAAPQEWPLRSKRSRPRRSAKSMTSPAIASGPVAPCVPGCPRDPGDPGHRDRGCPRGVPGCAASVARIHPSRGPARAAVCRRRPSDRPRGRRRASGDAGSRSPSALLHESGLRGRGLRFEVPRRGAPQHNGRPTGSQDLSDQTSSGPIRQARITPRRYNHDQTHDSFARESSSLSQPHLFWSRAARARARMCA
jgi:hypothetical protein